MLQDAADKLLLHLTQLAVRVESGRSLKFYQYEQNARAYRFRIDKP